MKKLYLILLAAVLIPAASIAQPAPETPEKKKKKLRTQPVLLSIEGIEQDSSMLQLFRQAFLESGVQLITAEEMKIRIDNEIRNVDSRMKGKTFTSPEEVQRAAADATNYVANMLTIDLEVDSKTGSPEFLLVLWRNTAMPVNTYRTMQADQEVREIDPAKLSGTTITEKVQSIVNIILSSRKLE